MPVATATDVATARLPALAGVRGRIELPALVLQGAALLAAQDFRQQQACEFTGDEVRDIDPPQWLPDMSVIVPASQLLALGFKQRNDFPPQLYATCGVGSHSDEVTGLSLCVVLFSDGFVFKKWRGTLRLRTGDWFVFDDRVFHEVLDDPCATSLVFMTVPLAARAGWRKRLQNQPGHFPCNSPAL